jgi:hypothetical protein
MPEIRIDQHTRQGNLFLPVSDVMLSEVIDETRKLAVRDPKILSGIKRDQDRVALEKKQLRLGEREWSRARTDCLPGLESSAPPSPVARELGTGRPRMDPECVLVFFVISHYFCSVYSSTAVERLLDSLSVYHFLSEKGIVMPGMRTIGDNVNAISAETRRLILQCQMQLVLDERLDDFQEVCGDSTACAANTRWPTDSSLILRLAERVLREGSRLDRFGLRNFRVHWTNQWLKKMGKLDFAINTAKGDRARRRLYKKFLETAEKVIIHLSEEAVEQVDGIRGLDLPPMLMSRMHATWSGMLDDIRDMCTVHRQCDARVLGGGKVRGARRVLSLSDEAAAYILKGDRVPVVGYKPQLARSRAGLVTALLVPEGNASDSSMLAPLVEESSAMTGVVPSLASFDDGYTSKAGLEKLREFGIEHVSFSGSKGRRLLGDEEWESEILTEARRNRSAVESLMFCIKHGHEFGQLRRRGIDAVRGELMGKVLVYNFCRIILLRKRKKNAEALPAAS